jgi:hypothetical protein
LTGTAFWGGVKKRAFFRQEYWYAHAMKKFLQTACGTALGVLIYTRWIGSAHAFEWRRAIFVGIVCGIVAAVWPDKKGHRGTGGS